ncbi:polysaccharide deacetylase family protein [Amycolatopsis sp. NPDC004368]
MHALSRLGAPAAVVAAAALAASCAVPAVEPAAQPAAVSAPSSPAAPARVTADIARAVGADELGRIPVLMYHRLTAHPDSVYERTPADFAAELERLAAEHYVPVTTADLTTRHLDLPAGAHPVVLTFDDGDPSAFSLTPQGAPAPGTAVRILLDVASAHPGFTPVASLYVNARPFGDDPRALPWLHQHGFEVGNHTADHTNLRTAGATAAEAAIRAGDTAIRDAIPGYAPTTLALPYGAHPRRTSLALRGAGYSYTGALLVGANPTPSPYSSDFDPESIPRIRSQSTGAEAGYGSTHWLDVLATPAGRRYTSDGDPHTVSFPRAETTLAPPYATVRLAY